MVYTMLCVGFANHIETNPHTKIALKYILLKTGLWSNLLRKTATKTTFFFSAGKINVCTRKKPVSVNGLGHDLHASFF